MPTRKVVQEASVGDSDLSPAPDGLLKNGHEKVNGRAQAPASKKRKVKEVKEKLVGVDVDVNGGAEFKGASNKTTRKRKVKAEEVVEEQPDENVGTAAKKGKKRKQKAEEEEPAEADGDSQVVEKKAKRKRKTKEEKEAEAMPLAARTAGHKLFIGAHVSSAGGVHNSVLNSVHIGANAFALFLKSQRKWANPPLADDHCTSFHANCESHSYKQNEHVVPHGSYLVNLAHTDKARTEQAYDAFLDDLKRCERLDIKLYNFHPGVANSTDGDRQAAIAHLASNINRAHKETSSVVTLLENMAAGGNVLGSTFEDLRDTIALIKNKDRVGVCLDTCHAFAAGYDLRTPAAFKATMDQFEGTVGFKYLRALHFNDSKAPFASHRDLHANIGTGFLGLRSFHNLVNDSRFEGLPLILETPLDATDADGVALKDEKGKGKEDRGIWAREIKMLESLVGMNIEGKEFGRLEAELARKGEKERKRLLEQMEKKRTKEEKKVKSAGKKKAKKVKEDESDAEELLSELEDEAEADAVADTQRFAD